MNQELGTQNSELRTPIALLPAVSLSTRRDARIRQLRRALRTLSHAWLNHLPVPPHAQDEAAFEAAPPHCHPECDAFLDAINIFLRAEEDVMVEIRTNSEKDGRGNTRQQIVTRVGARL